VPVSVIVPHYGPEDILTPCIDSLEPFDIELIVVDGNERNDGFAGNCNRGAKDATSDVLVFLNNDCRVFDDWLDPLVAPLERYPIAGSLLLRPDGRVQHAGVNVMVLPGGGVVAKNITGRRGSGTVAAVTGASLAITADLFFAVGCFDTGYWNGYEDVDLCLKAKEHTGRQCWFAVESVATHLESQSGSERWIAVSENEARLRQKWGDQ